MDGKYVIQEGFVLDKQRQITEKSMEPYSVIIEIHKYNDEEKHFWSVTRARVFKEKTEVAVVDRCYADFPFQIITKHPDGHDYLICASNYQGLTVVQLDTGERIDWLPKSAEMGAGWIHYDFQEPERNPSIDNVSISILTEGCVWGCENCAMFKRYSLETPMTLPWPLLSSWDVDPPEEEDEENGDD